MINFMDLAQQNKSISQEINKDVLELIREAKFVDGDALYNFEDVLRAINNSQYAIGVGSGLDALQLSLLALDIGPGDEVIVPTNTFIATAFAVSHTGATPVFADVTYSDYNIDAEHVEELINTNTKAVIAVHLYGYPANMNKIKEVTKKYEIKLIEDCAQAIGARYKGEKVGNFGEAGCISFYPTKNLGGLAQGGAVVTNSFKLAEKVRQLGNVGRSEQDKNLFTEIGFNSRLDSINALFMHKYIISGRWARNTMLRRGVAEFYTEYLSEVEEITLPPGHLKDPEIEPVFHLYPIKVETPKLRNLLMDGFKLNGIGCGVYYPIPCHKQPVYRSGDFLPVAEDLAETTVCLPMNPYVTEEQVIYIADYIKKFFRE